MRANTFYYSDETRGIQYYNSKGQLVLGEAHIGDNWYLFDKNNGNMKTGFQNLAAYSFFVFGIYNQLVFIAPVVVSK